MNIEKFGNLESDKLAGDILKCRQIVKEILKFGVSEQQKLNIIHFLALELESSEQMVQIVELIKSFGTKSLIIDSVDDEEL